MARNQPSILNLQKPETEHTETEQTEDMIEINSCSSPVETIQPFQSISNVTVAKLQDLLAFVVEVMGGSSLNYLPPRSVKKNTVNK